MGTLASALRPIAADLADAPRVYVDANMPAGVVSAMRRELHWDVFFVMEHDDLRRAADAEHFRRVCFAPDEAGLIRLLRQLDRDALRAADATPLPLRGRKIQIAPDPQA